MNTRNAPLSPVSIGGSEWSGVSKYPTDGPYPNPRGLASPPNSGGSSGIMNGNGFPGGPRSIGGPSPPPSIGRSSTYARSESGRSIRDENTDAVLGEHYSSLKRYLASTSRDGTAQPPPNKARDKLLRLSSVQFLELSTDVFDELMRRQTRRPPPGAPHNAQPPPFLQPEKNFHPKRNQARQKLSTLGSPRFRDLATDVFCELERRIPHVINGEPPRRSQQLPPSRTGTPVNGMGIPRGPGMRRPSDASSIRSAGPPRYTPGDYPVPPSPGLPPNGQFERPPLKQFQSNTIVPNKSTMVEEDDDGASSMGSNNGEPEALAIRGRDSKMTAPNPTNDADKKVIDDYQKQVQELREQLDNMGNDLKRKEEEIGILIDKERSRTVASDTEKREWDDLRANLEGKLADADNLSNSMRDELNRLRDDHATETQQLQAEIEDARQSSGGPSDSETMRENEELRLALQEQQEVTEDARREARQFLEEMRALSQQHMPSWEKQAELEKQVQQLEQEVHDWRNRYARTKTQLRNMRASSIGLTIEQDAGRYLNEKGFTEANGLVKDVHVTKFQISIDELLKSARTDEPGKVIERMKSVIVSVRRITRDIEDSRPVDEEGGRQQQKLKTRVSATANNLITASKNFASAAGISPVSLLDAAASHLVASLVELLRTVKIRATPAAELEDDDDGSITPVDSTGFFSNRTTTTHPDEYAKADSPLNPPQLQGLRVGARDSGNSSAYSPYNSPRGSYQPRPLSRPNGQPNGNINIAYNGLNKGLTQAPNGYTMQDTELQDLKIYLEDQTALMVDHISSLVETIRGDAPIQQINDKITAIAEVVENVVSETEHSRRDDEMLERLSSCRQRFLEAGEHGKELAGRGLDENDRDWRMWTQTLPPIAFNIVRETKELIQRVDRMAPAPNGRDYS
ncbi:hypothetical protein F5Y18DRAFT_303991 [Xylariaceae sp. FL1019]|nr:hypothetical protein F5Y18DRAFT_303991 [Xylariaceae sp. FL1019]